MTLVGKPVKARDKAAGCTCCGQRTGKEVHVSHLDRQTRRYRGEEFLCSDCARWSATQDRGNHE